jgi:two-component system phosphate regulon sensor histidine kinase PhoR
LAIVKQIIERHRGSLDMRSTVGVGTSVSVRLPVAA